MLKLCHTHKKKTHWFEQMEYKNAFIETMSKRTCEDCYQIHLYSKFYQIPRLPQEPRQSTYDALLEFTLVELEVILFCQVGENNTYLSQSLL